MLYVMCSMLYAICYMLYVICLYVIWSYVIHHISYIIDHISLVDPALSHKGRWAIPALLHRWWADVGAALQAANAEAILASLGFEGGAGAALAETDAAAFELLLPLASA